MGSLNHNTPMPRHDFERPCSLWPEEAFECIETLKLLKNIVVA
jgi:hypothetical protein